MEKKKMKKKNEKIINVAKFAVAESGTRSSWSVAIQHSMSLQPLTKTYLFMQIIDHKFITNFINTGKNT